MHDNLVETLYDLPIDLANGKKMFPLPVMESGYVQYGRRLPNDLPCSVLDD